MLSCSYITGELPNMMCTPLQAMTKASLKAINIKVDPIGKQIKRCKCSKKTAQVTSQSGVYYTGVGGLTVSPGHNAWQVSEVGSFALGYVADPEVVIKVRTQAYMVSQRGIGWHSLQSEEVLQHLHTACNCEVPHLQLLP